ncbi:MAG: hypothetical protein LBE82_09790 [Chitinophagaceae bacterium]|jgi:hypothetical protein|nr:hypothetical protein [Chitinophagaceae bacterium]
MNLQFLYCYNPNVPAQGEFIEHHGYPRFTAQIVNNELVIVRKLDGEDADYTGKLNRAKKWYFSIKSNVRGKG